MAVYETVDPDESKDRADRYAGIDPQYEGRLGAVFADDESAPRHRADETEAEGKKVPETIKAEAEGEKVPETIKTPPAAPSI